MSEETVREDTVRADTRRTWLIPVIIASILFAATAYWGYTQYRQKQQLLVTLNNRNQKAFFELVDQVENMEVLLAKGIVSSSDSQRELLFSDIWLQASAAQGNLGLLPISHFQLARTAKFFNQAGDYSYSLQKKLAQDQQLTAKEENRLEGLHEEAGFLLAELQKIRAQAADGRLSWGEIEQQGSRLRQAGASPLVDGVTRIDKDMQRYPTLIYDGPFSDHIDTLSPKGLTGPTVTAQEAREIATRFLGQGNKPMFVFRRQQSVDARIPAYRIHFSPAAGAGPTAVVDVSRKGGHVVMMIVNRAAGNRAVSVKEAEDRASAYLKARGLNNMVKTYSLTQANNAVISYAYQEDGVVIYPDLIKVKVALDNGDIVGFEAMGYLMSHQKRDLPEPKVSMEEARKKVNSRLNIQQSRLVVIPTETRGEKQCYEFKGNLNGDPFIVYIDAMTGREERVVKIINTRDGTLAM